MFPYEVRNLNGLSKNGIKKQWIYPKDKFYKVMDCLQKISYSIQDLNEENPYLKEFDRKRIVYIVVLVDWIKEAFDCLVSSIHKSVAENFIFSKQKLLDKCNDFFTSIRSFIVAHPLSTNRHPKYGFDGNYICIDIRNYCEILPIDDDSFYYKLDVNGLYRSSRKNNDFYLFCYSQTDDGMKYFRKNGCNYKDIYLVVETYIEKLYELDRYLKNQKKADYRC